MPTIRNLVFQGGGVKGSAYAGAIGVLAQGGALADVRRVAGTSAGAITATMLAIGAGPEGLMRSVRETDFGSFLDIGWNLLADANRLLHHFGVAPGAHFAELLGDEVARYTGDRGTTLGQLRAKAEAHPGHFHDLYIVTSNLTRQRSQVLCADNHPEMPVWLAVRASMSMPFIFEPVRVGDDVFVDGGLSWNYPVDLFDHPEVYLAGPRGGHPRTEETLGFSLEPKALFEAGVRDWSSLPGHTESLLAYTTSLMGFLSETANAEHLHAADLPRTIFIDDLGVRATDFKAPKAVIERLIASGADAARAWLARRSLVGVGE
ncbi:MAG: patatin-like phospholipase family protein [Candidatus Sericytochromatia bacterium]|nr:patatin-like phospholipase family protein [Candidatus Sericytochromatia bacterium]